MLLRRSSRSAWSSATHFSVSSSMEWDSKSSYRFTVKHYFHQTFIYKNPYDRYGIADRRKNLPFSKHFRDRHSRMPVSLRLLNCLGDLSTGYGVLPTLHASFETEATEHESSFIDPVSTVPPGVSAQYNHSHEKTGKIRCSGAIVAAAHCSYRLLVFLAFWRQNPLTAAKFKECAFKLSAPADAPGASMVAIHAGEGKCHSLKVVRQWDLSSSALPPPLPFLLVIMWQELTHWKNGV